jgi:hypothetical protein
MLKKIKTAACIPTYQSPFFALEWTSSLQQTCMHSPFVCSIIFACLTVFDLDDYIFASCLLVLLLSVINYFVEDHGEQRVREHGAQRDVVLYGTTN